MRARLTVGGALLVGWGLLMGAWAMSNAPGASPDEPAHYIKAIAAGHGVLIGSNDVATIRQLEPGVPPFVVALTRLVEIDPRLDFGNFGCNAFQPDKSASCLTAPPLQHGAIGSDGRELTFTYIGTYQPFVYPVPGLVMRLAGTRDSALYLGRLACVVVSLFFLAMTLSLHLGDRPPDPRLVLGLLVTVTPMVVFASASLSSSAFEISAGIAVWAAILRLRRDGGGSRLPWLALAIAGSTLALSRSFSPLWLFLDAVVVVGFFGWRQLGSVLRRRALTSGAVIGLIAAATAVDLGWQVIVQPRTHIVVSQAVQDFVIGVDHVPALLGDQVGLFGWLDTSMPHWAYLLYETLIGAVILLAWLAGSRRDRRGLTLAVVITLLLPPVMYSLIAVPAGGVEQGRWMLPFTAGVPLLCTEILVHDRQRLLDPRRLLLAGGAVVVLVQAVAWYQNSRRNSVGASGRTLFFTAPQWSPPGGWYGWMGMVAAACAALLLGMIAARRQGMSDDAAALLPPAPAPA